MKSRFVRAGLCTLALTPGSLAVAQQEELQQRVAALKGSLAASQQSLRQYEWIETTAISLRGEEKSRKQNRCYYGADGQLQKVPVTAPAPEKKKRGLRGRIAENKKEELADYMQEAVNLVRQYVPPDPARIQAAKDAGKASIHLTDPGKRARLQFRDYLKPGDSLAVDLDLQTNRLLGVKVATFLEPEKDPVGLDVSFGTLNDGTSYPANVSLEAKGKSLGVTVQNSGYRKMGQ